MPWPSKIKVSLYKDGYETTSEKKDMYAVINNMIMEKLQNGVAPWRQTWNNFGPARNYVSKKTKLFNRWGQEIFTIESSDTVWDGSGCAFGTYYWIAEYTGFNSKVYSKKGIVQLLR